MQKIKSKSFVLIILIVIFSGIVFYILNLIFTTLKFDPPKNKTSRGSKYSYVILSSEDIKECLRKNGILCLLLCISNLRLNLLSILLSEDDIT